MDPVLASIIVVGYRLLIPFAILRWPLAGFILAMIADASDAVVFEATGWGLFEGRYSYWDKGLDIWYLFFAWLATRKYWTNPLARKTGSFLFWWRAVGVVTFFIWPHRIIFVLAPSIFENFYILWTAIRKWWSGWQLNKKRLVILLVIATVPKMAQEVMMHWLFENSTWGFFRAHLFWWLY